MAIRIHMDVEGIRRHVAVNAARGCGENVRNVLRTPCIDTERDGEAAEGHAGRAEWWLRARG